MTIEGKLDFARTILRTKRKNKENPNVTDKKEFIALDEYFGFEKLPFKMTKNLTDETAFWAQNQGSYKQAQEIMRERRGINISCEHIRKVAMYVGGLVYDRDQERANNIETTMKKIPEKPSKPGVLYAMMDGSMLNMREDFDKKFDWREVKLGTAFAAKYLKPKSGKPGRHIIAKKEFTVCTEKIEEFRKEFFENAVRNGYGEYEKMVVIADGAPWIAKLKEDFFPDAIQILDFFHLAENIYKAAKFIFKNDAEKYTPWAENIIDHLRNSRAETALELLSEYKNVKFGDGALNPYVYVSNHKENIDYASYLRAGYLIGSGPIESANKTVVQKRCKQSGMRWLSKNAQKMLSLRAKMQSKLWKTDVTELLAAA
jgi:hypothetical protein